MAPFFMTLEDCRMIPIPGKPSLVSGKSESFLSNLNRAETNHGADKTWSNVWAGYPTGPSVCKEVSFDTHPSMQSPGHGKLAKKIAIAQLMFQHSRFNWRTWHLVSRGTKSLEMTRNGWNSWNEKKNLMALFSITNQLLISVFCRLWLCKKYFCKSFGSAPKLRECLNTPIRISSLSSVLSCVSVFDLITVDFCCALGIITERFKLRTINPLPGNYSITCFCGVVEKVRLEKKTSLVSLHAVFFCSFECKHQDDQNRMQPSIIHNFDDMMMISEVVGL